MIELKLETRKQRLVRNSLVLDAPIPGLQFAVDGFLKQFPAARHKTKVPCLTYNCHGLTFAARRTEINDPVEVLKILQDDGYERIQDHKAVLPGDVVIYYRAGDIEHSGVVCEVPLAPLFNVRVLSKWGAGQEVLHWVRECPYDSADVRYFRLAK